MKDEDYTENLCMSTCDASFQDEEYGISSTLRGIIDMLCYNIQHPNKKGIIDDLKYIISRCPQVPILKNYLAIAYYIRGHEREAFEVNSLLLAEHPDYLIAKLNRANEYMDMGEVGKVPELLAPMSHLSNMYPSRTYFHIDEIAGYFRTLIRYYKAIGDDDEVNYWTTWMHELEMDELFDEDDPWFIFLYPDVEKSTKEVEDAEQCITPTPCFTVPKLNNSEPPHLNHQQLYQLYHCGATIPQELVRELLALPHQTLASDLELMLDDAQKRYGFFVNSEKSDMLHFMVQHVLMLLTEINATQSLNKILQFLDCDTEFLLFWGTPLCNRSMWQCIFILGHNQLDLLKQRLLKPGLSPIGKCSIIIALGQQVLHHPEKREDILNIFRDVISIFSTSTPEDNIIDSWVFSRLISCVVECQFEELLPYIKILFSNYFIPTSSTGDYSEVKQKLLVPPTDQQKLDVIRLLD